MGCVCCKLFTSLKSAKGESKDGIARKPKISAKQRELIKSGRNAIKYHMGEIGVAGFLG